MTELTGRTLQNRYRVDSFIGRGGMADVYKVWDQNRAVYLAMKVLHADLAEDRAFLRRFKREADTLAKLQHPHIVRSYGLETDGRIAFILMDYIEGVSLRTRIFDLDRPFTSEEALEIMQPVCAALHYAHQSGVVHCDIKPANIMLHKNGTVLVSDFGISRITEAATATMVGAGTPAYMSPEQARGADLTPLSDIYSLGIVLYEMLSGGERPFIGEHAKVTGGTSEKVRWEQINAAPPALRKLNPQISSALEAVVLKCLQKDPAQRYPSALDALNALIQAAGSSAAPQPKASPVAPVESLPELHERQPGVMPQRKLTAFPPRSRPSKRSLTPFVVGAVLLVLVLFFVAISRPLGVMFSPATLTPTLRPTVTPTPTPAAGDVMVSEKDGMRLHYVPFGEFVMGNTIDAAVAECEKFDSGCSLDLYESNGIAPPHKVTLKAFWIDETEVTNKMYALCVEDGKCQPPGDESSSTRTSYYGDRHYTDYPVIHVSWNDAKAYCEWAGRALPSEAQWEKAARGPNGNTYPWGNAAPDKDLLNYSRSNVGDTTQVGLYPEGASPYGALDMAGNVAEWVADWWNKEYYQNSPAIDPPGPATGFQRGLRGGAWDDYEFVVSSTYRYLHKPGESDANIGFRCVRPQ